MNTQKNYDLYGFAKTRLESVRVAVEAALNVAFERRDSSYRGGEYFRCASTNGGEFILQTNHDDSSGDWAEDAFQQHSTLLYATTGTENDAVKNAVASIGGQLLRRQVL